MTSSSELKPQKNMSIFLKYYEAIFDWKNIYLSFNSNFRKHLNIDDLLFKLLTMAESASE